MTADAVRRLSERLGYRFEDERLAAAALVHRSAEGQSNERLEFLGDAVIALVTAAWLFEHKPTLAEGDLTRLRASLVNREALAELADSLDLGALLKLGGGERQRGGSRSMLEDTFEAVIGAVFVDGGYASAREILHRLFAQRLAALPAAEALKDPKTRLQEKLQARGLERPQYELVAARGPDHARHFEVECRVAALALSDTGQGASKRVAEQAAAAAILARLGD